MLTRREKHAAMKIIQMIPLVAVLGLASCKTYDLPRWCERSVWEDTKGETRWTVVKGIDGNAAVDGDVRRAFIESWDTRADEAERAGKMSMRVLESPHWDVSFWFYPRDEKQPDGDGVWRHREVVYRYSRKGEASEPSMMRSTQRFSDREWLDEGEDDGGKGRIYRKMFSPSALFSRRGTYVSSVRPPVITNVPACLAPKLWNHTGETKWRPAESGEAKAIAADLRSMCLPERVYWPKFFKKAEHEGLLVFNVFESKKHVVVLWSFPMNEYNEGTVVVTGFHYCLVRKKDRLTIREEGDVEYFDKVRNRRY